MAKKSDTKKSIVEEKIHDQRMGARRTMMEEIFNDMYDDRKQVYIMNFFRGLFFGLGSVLGGTIVVALLVWTLSFFVQLPGIGQAAENAKDSLQSGEKK